MRKFRENAKNWFFWAYFRHFQLEKMFFFKNWAQSHFRYCHFASVCKTLWKNIEYSSRNPRNNVFLTKNWLFWWFLESSGYKNHLVGIVIKNVLCTVKNKIFKDKARWKSAKKVISSIFQTFSAGKNFFSKIDLGHALSIANAHLYGKIRKNKMMKSRENAKKPVFPA